MKSDHWSLLKHSRNYLLANVATKALAFVSIPVYTRLMTVEEYGVVNVFLSVSGIVAILITLNSDVAISRYYYEAKSNEDFKEFVGTTISLSIVICIIMSIIGLCFISVISELLSFPVLLTLSLLPVGLYKKTNIIFTQIYQPMEKSKVVAAVSSIQVYLAFILSAICILLFEKDKYYGYVLGVILAMLITGVYMFKKIKAYCTLCFKKSHLFYILNFCLPYIPYSLSGIIISQFARIFISSQEGYNSAGVYSLANNLTALMLVAIFTTHDAWNPFYFRYMNQKDYNSLTTDYDLIWRVTILAALFISLFALEGGIILAGYDYYGSLYICPILVLGYLFYQWAYVYLRNTGYAKRNIWNALAVIISGFSNVIFNALLIPAFSDLGGAMSLMLSYLLLMIISYSINKFVLKLFAPPFKNFFYPLVFFAPIIVACVKFYTLGFSLWLFVLKVALFVFLFLILILPYRERAIDMIKQIKNKN